MIVIHGVYHVAHQMVAYRNDYCRTCDAPRLAFQHRTFDILHVFWVPVLPLGLWSRWRCSACNTHPHQRVRTNRGMMWAGVMCLLLFTVAFWEVDPGQDAAFTWSMRVAAPLGTVLAVRAALKATPDVDLKERLRLVEPIMAASCPVCHVGLMPAEPWWRCPRCRIERRALPAA